MSEVDITEMAGSLRVRTFSDDNEFDHITFDQGNCISSSSCSCSSCSTGSSSCSSSSSSSCCSSEWFADENYPSSISEDDLQSCPLHLEPAISRNAVLAVYSVAFMLLLITGVSSYFHDAAKSQQHHVLINEQVNLNDMIPVEIVNDSDRGPCISVWTAMKCNYGPSLRRLASQSQDLMEQVHANWLMPIGHRISDQLAQQIKTLNKKVKQLPFISNLQIGESKNRECDDIRIIRSPRDTAAMRPTRTHDEL